MNSVLTPVALSRGPEGLGATLHLSRSDATPLFGDAKWNLRSMALALETDEAPPLGAALSLCVQLAGDPAGVEARGVVVSVKERAAGGGWHVAVRLTQLDPGDFLRLSALDSAAAEGATTSGSP